MPVEELVLAVMMDSVAELIVEVVTNLVVVLVTPLVMPLVVNRLLAVSVPLPVLRSARCPLTSRTMLRRLLLLPLSCRSSWEKSRR